MSGNLAMDSHAPAFLSVHDIHAYYGESYIVQGVSFNVHEAKSLRCWDVTVLVKHQPCVQSHVWMTQHW
jgi:hypothetical protein